MFRNNEELLPCILIQNTVLPSEAINTLLEYSAATTAAKKKLLEKCKANPELAELASLLQEKNSDDFLLLDAPILAACKTILACNQKLIGKSPFTHPQAFAQYATKLVTLWPKQFSLPWFLSVLDYDTKEPEKESEQSSSQVMNSANIMSLAELCAQVMMVDAEQSHEIDPELMPAETLSTKKSDIYSQHQDRKISGSQLPVEDFAKVIRLMITEKKEQSEEEAPQKNIRFGLAPDWIELVIKYLPIRFYEGHFKPYTESHNRQVYKKHVSHILKCAVKSSKSDVLAWYFKSFGMTIDLCNQIIRPIIVQGKNANVEDAKFQWLMASYSKMPAEQAFTCPIQFILYSSNLHLRKWLVQNGYTHDRVGNTLCHLTVTKENGLGLKSNDKAEYRIGLLKWATKECGVDINKKNDKGESALALAIKNENVSEDVIFWMLKQAKVDFTAVDSHGDTMLHLAVRSRRIKVLDWILNSGKIDINTQNLRGETALHVVDCSDTCAVENHFTDYTEETIVEMLLEKKADPTIKNSNGVSFIDILNRWARGNALGWTYKNASGLKKHPVIVEAIKNSTPTLTDNVLALVNSGGNLLVNACDDFIRSLKVDGEVLLLPVSGPLFSMTADQGQPLLLPRQRNTQTLDFVSQAQKEQLGKGKELVPDDENEVTEAKGEEASESEKPEAVSKAPMQ